MTNEEIFIAVKDSIVNVCSLSSSTLLLMTPTETYQVQREEFEKDYLISFAPTVKRVGNTIYPNTVTITKR